MPPVEETQPYAFFDEEPPPVGELTVVGTEGESFARLLLATSLQGIVNRSEVRLYLVPGEPLEQNRWWEAEGEEASQRYWLQRYEDELGVAVAGEVGLDEALGRFAGEAVGYVVASEDEDWTIDVATTMAGIEGALVATPDTAPALDALGLAELDDLRGRWSSLDEATAESFALLYPDSNPRAVAALAPDEHRLRDFLVQRCVWTGFGRPLGLGWDSFLEALDGVPPDQPVLGYLSLTGTEEVVAVQALSERGLALVPSDTAPNLSVHASMRADLVPAAPVTSECAEDALMVAVAISDGDNLAIPIVRYAGPEYWLAPERGSLPLGWSLSPALAALAPFVAAAYQAEVAPQDEIVAMLGAAYAYPSRMPDAEPFLDETWAWMDATGTHTLWQLDPWMADPEEPAWDALDVAFADGSLDGVLWGYQGNAPVPWRTAGGLPVAQPASAYDDTPADLADKIRNARDAWLAGTGPSRVFANAPVWSNDVPGLVLALTAVEAEGGVRFVAPAALLSCVD